MADAQSVLFVAGDGASGRIMVNLMKAMQRQNSVVRKTLLVQEDGGAQALCKSENRSYLMMNAGLNIGRLLAEYQCVVAGLSGSKWQLENRVILAAFDRMMPVIRVSDHPLSVGHAHLADMVQDWREKGQPPFTLTAVNEFHARDLAQYFPEFGKQRERIFLAGNPLNSQLDVMRERLVQAHEELRKKYVIGAQELVIAIFLSGEEFEFREMLDICSASLKYAQELCRCSGAQVSVLVNVHHELGSVKLEVDRALMSWRKQFTFLIKEGVPHDEMIVASDVIITSPFSTTSERAIACGIPVIQVGTKCVAARLSELSGKSFPYTPELSCGAVLWAETPDAIPQIFTQALRTWDQRKRREAAELAGLIAPTNAVENIVHFLLDRQLARA